MENGLNTEFAKPAAMKVQHESVPMERYVGASATQAVVEGEVALPGGLREETRVLGCEALALIDRCEAMSDRVSVDGKVTFHVLYTQGDPTHIAALEAGAEFTHSPEVRGSQPKQNAVATAMVEHVEASAQSGRLRLRAILRVYARVMTDAPVSVVVGVTDAPGLTVQTAALPACVTVSAGAAEALVRNEFALSDVLQVQDTLYATANATVQDVMGGEDRLTVAGEIQLEVTHRSQMPSRPLVTTRHTLPFEESFALTGQPGDAISCAVAVRDVAVLSQEGQQEGERVLRAEVLLGLNARGVRQTGATVLRDVYTTQGDLLTPVYQPTMRAVGYQQVHTAESGKLTLLLDGEQPPARTPIKAILRPVLISSERQNGKLTVEGMMETTLLYMTDDSEAPVTLHTEEPFTMAFACELCDPESVQLVPTNVEASGVTSDRVEIKYILHLTAGDVQLESEPVVSDVQRAPAEPTQPGIVLYFTQDRETLWDIAKRYRVSQESIQRMNPELTADAPCEAGRSVILWQR